MPRETLPVASENKQKKGFIPKVTDVLRALLQANANQSKEKISKPKRNLMGNGEKVLRDLEKRHIKLDEIEMYGKKGVLFQVELPVVGNFKGFKFEAFIPNERITKRDFLMNDEYKNNTYEYTELLDFKRSLYDYMREYKVGVYRTDEYYMRMLWFKMKDGDHRGYILNSLSEEGDESNETTFYRRNPALHGGDFRGMSMDFYGDDVEEYMLLKPKK